jgi:hypothetical protein
MSEPAFDEYEVVRLVVDLPIENLKKGVTGTILMIFREPNPIPHYIVEFMDAGNSLGTPIVAETMLESVVS